MKKLFLFLLPLFFILTSCGDDSSIKYNDKLVSYHDNAIHSVDSLYDVIEDDIENGDFSKISVYTRATAESLQSNLDKMNALEIPSGAEEFHKTTIGYFESLIGYVNTMGEQYSQVNDSTSEDQFNDIEDLIEKVLNASEEKHDVMISAQKAFARLKNFELVEK